jgi:glyoxylase-like metal-dependent hydrolase (beta-lactamase superfamily II)
MKTIGAMNVVTFAHPQGCRGYLIADRASKEALALDVHLDYVHDMAARVKAEGWKLRYVMDTHTHADHPSGSQALAAVFNCPRVAHEKANHVGVTVCPKDGEQIPLGSLKLTVRHAPGHTPDHMALVADGALYAGVLFDSIHALLAALPDTTVLFPGHDYQKKMESTIGTEKSGNPWLRITDRAEFVRNLVANPPPRPANMDDLLRLNREGVAIPATVAAADAARVVANGGATCVIDVRTGAEYEGEHIPGSRLIPVDQIEARADEVRATPAPRLLLCQSGNRATTARLALEKLHVAGLSVIQGGIAAYIQAGGITEKGKAHMSLERQVRIVAGGMVLTGVLLGVLVHPVFLIIAGFVGAGLIFAGVTNWCGMALILGKMPWNQTKGSGAPPTGGTCSASMPGSCAASTPGSCAAKPPSPQ